MPRRRGRWEVADLQSILVGTNAGPGQAATCPAGTICIDSAFAVLAGSTATSLSWSNSTLVSNALGAWYADFGTGVVQTPNKTFELFVRAVRTGDCDR